MPARSVVSARLDEKTKKEAIAVLKSMGLTPSSAFQLMLERVIESHELPFDVSHLKRQDDRGNRESAPQ